MKKINTFHELYHNDQTPDTDDNYVGVEIECYSSADRETIAAKLFAAGVADHVHLKDDGSIEPEPCKKCDGEGGSYKDTRIDGFMESEWVNCPRCKGEGNRFETYELAVLAKQSEYAEVIRKVCGVLKHVHAMVNDTCGLHVHLDMRNRNPDKAYKNLLLVQDVLYKMNPVARKEGDYCMPEDSDAEFYDRVSNGDRYSGINARAYQQHKTIEVRIHAGTVKANDIIRWADLLIRVADCKMIAKDVVTLRGLKTYVPLDRTLSNYVSRRVRKFKEDKAA